jgi:4a-hydroxytetrahydrobiopterin dehydratase
VLNSVHYSNSVRTIDQAVPFQASQKKVAVTFFCMLRGMAKRLTDTEIQERLAALDGWTLDGDAIRKQYTLGGFPDAVAFVTRLAFDAEAADHHPDILINYKRVTLTFSTHSEGGLTQKDFDGARKVDALL